jgi:peptidoglycan/LPS O-acetylase OafA/YrhL
MGQATAVSSRKSSAVDAGGRFRYLDGVRGLASLQVLISHCLLAFAPGTERTAGFLADGDFAVLLFFVMSGFVLTFSFERQAAALPAVVLSRFFRLALPVAAASLLGLLLLLAMPDAHVLAGDLSGSSFLGGKSVASPVRAAADILGVTMWTGSSHTTIFGFLARVLPGTESSVDPPIWSMHLELWGSILVLALVMVSRTKWILAGAVLFAAALAGANAMALFLCGFLIAHLTRVSTVSYQLRQPRTWVAGAVLMVTGILLTSEWANDHGVGVLDSLASHSLLGSYEWYHPRKAFSALLVFLGILAFQPVQRPLSTPVAEWLGRCSFAIYLLHFPILMTIGSLTYIAAHQFGQITAAAATMAVVGAATFWLAPLFETWIDRPSVSFARRLRVGKARSSTS